MSTRTQIAAAIAGLVLIRTAPARADGGGTPAFARQTGLACSACHTHYPELTATGRAFKLNGYVYRRSDSLQATNPGGQQNLLLNLVPPISIMLQTSFTSTQKAQPNAQNGTILFPDQMSLFVGGEVTPHVGGFLQVTFDPQSGQLGIDNADFRYAGHTTVLNKRTTFGFSLNNNPTVQDLWNSTPAWGFPYGSSAAAPTPAAAAMIDGTLG
ncbi:MAG: cytochrome C, partial [Gemmatimonadetes bacterium]